jgi:hypothetical protein
MRPFGRDEQRSAPAFSLTRHTMPSCIDARKTVILIRRCPRMPILGNTRSPLGPTT